MADNTRVGIQIDQQYLGHEKMAQALLDAQWYNAEVQKLKASADMSTAGASRLADSMVRQADSTRRVRTEMEALSSSNGKLNGHLSQTVQQAASAAASFQAMPGPIGAAAGAASGLSGILAAATGPIGLWVLGTAAATAGAGLLAKTLVDNATALANHTEHVQVIGLQTGLTSRETERFDAAMKNMGLTVESLTPAFRFLNSNIVEAIAKQGDARKAFDALGISVQDLRDKTSGQIFEATIRGLGQIESQSVRSDTAVKILGRSALAVLPLAGTAFEEAGRQAERMGLVLTESEKRVGESIDKSRDSMARAQEGMKLQAGVLASVLVDPFMKMEAAAAEGAASVLRSLTVMATSGKTAVDAVDNAALKLLGTLGRVAEKVTGIDWRNVAAAAANQMGIPFISVTPGQKAPTSQAPNLGLSQEQTDAIKAVHDQIQGYEWIRQNRKMAASEELGLLQTMEKQAIALQDEVVAARELEIIRGRIAAMAPAMMTEAKRTAGEMIQSFPVAQLPSIIPSKPFEPVFDNKFLLSTEEAKRRIEEWRKSIEKLSAMEQREMAIMAESRAALESGIHSFFSDVITGTKTIGQAFGQMVKWIVEQVAISTGTNAVLGALGIGAAVAMPAAAPVLTWVAKGGTIASPPSFIPAQHGLILSGVRGRDTVPISAQKGEMFVSRQDTDNLRRMADIFLRGQSSGSKIDERPTTVNYVTVPVTVNTVMADEKSIRQACEEQIGPILSRVMDSGAMRGR